ncbi:MAG: HAMP domain-containing protein, partial [Defluviitaleaceae bacterium]|nr:HAMP domain-containing protein [Defluviitaleaceae bacterium]
MSIRWKLVMMYIALVFLVMLISGTFIIFSLQLQEETRAEHDLAQTARHIEDTVIRNSFRVPEFFIEDGQEAFEELFSQNFDLVGFPLSVQAFIISGEDWRTIVSTEDDLVGEYDFFTTSVVVAAKAGQSNFSAGRDYISSIEGRIPWFEYAMPVFLEEFRENNQRIDNIPDYIIYVRERADDFNDRLLSTTLAIGFSSLIALFGASVLGLLFSNSITKHILILNRQVKDFAGGMLTGRLEVPSNDEIGQLTESFNNMASALELTITQTTNEKNKTEIILYNMT